MHRYCCLGLTLLATGASATALMASGNETQSRLFIDFTAEDGLVKANGNPFYIKGISWFGMETRERVPQGLQPHATTFTHAFKALHKENFNAVRIPLAMDSIKNNEKVPTTQVSGSPKLVGKRYLEVLDEMIKVAADNSMLVMLDNHRLRAINGAIPELWYHSTTPNIMEITEGLDIVIDRYCSDSAYWNVFAIDLKHEPHGRASWGIGNPNTDWDAAAKQLSDHILTKCDRFLVFVEGVQKNVAGEGFNEGLYGGALQGVKKHPIKLSGDRMKRLVYSPHTYGPDTDGSLSWWRDSTFPKNMEGVWDTYFGFVPAETKQPVVVGAWGSKMDDNNGVWAEELVKYLVKNKIGSFYWALNPQSGNTGGLIHDDWGHFRQDRIQLLRELPSSSVDDLIEEFKKCPEGACYGNGKCIDGKCVCNPGWSGPQCQACSNGDKTACNSEGTCSANACKCNSESSGKYCTIFKCDGVECGSSNAVCLSGQCMCTICQGSECPKCSASGNGYLCSECPASGASSTTGTMSLLTLIAAAFLLATN